MRASGTLCVLLLGLGLLLCAVPSVDGRKHELMLNNEKREYFIVSTFGLLQGGVISLSIEDVSDNNSVCMAVEGKGSKRGSFGGELVDV